MKNLFCVLCSPYIFSLTMFLVLWCTSFMSLVYTPIFVSVCVNLHLYVWFPLCTCVCVHTSIESWQRSRRRLPAAPPSRGKWVQSPQLIRAPLKSALSTKMTPFPPPTRTSMDSVSENPLWFRCHCAIPIESYNTINAGIKCSCAVEVEAFQKQMAQRFVLNLVVHELFSHSKICFAMVITQKRHVNHLSYSFFQILDFLF